MREARVGRGLGAPGTKQGREANYNLNSSSNVSNYLRYCRERRVIGIRLGRPRESRPPDGAPDLVNSRINSIFAIRRLRNYPSV
jgi:hypothetical protein